MNEPQKIIAIFIFVLACFLFLWELIATFSLAKKEQVLIPLASNKMEQVNLRIDSPLFKTPLFGTYLPTNIADADIKQSMLDAEVVGIVFATREDKSQVIIRIGERQEKNYCIGDHLPGGAIIKRITEKGVVVLHKGALEGLSLPKNELVFEAPAKPLIGE